MIAIKVIVTIPRADDPLGKKAEEWAEGYRESGLLEKFEEDTLNFYITAVQFLEMVRPNKVCGDCVHWESKTEWCPLVERIVSQQMWCDQFAER